MKCLDFALFAVVVASLSAESDTELFARAAALHARIFTIDTHLDTPTLSLRRPGWDITHRHDAITDVSQCDFPRMRDGGLKAGVFAAFLEQKARTPQGYADARDTTLQLLMRMHRLAARHADQCELASTAGEAEQIARTGKRAILLSIENGHAIGRDLTLLKTYRDLGVRIFGMVHTRNNDLADSGGEKLEWNGLSPLGRQVVDECNRLGLVIDASHASDAATREIIARSKAPVVLTHSGCRAVKNHGRNVDDALLRELAAGGGVIQIVADNGFLTKSPPQPEIAAALAQKLTAAANARTEAERAEIEREWYRTRRALLTKLKVRATFDDFMQHIFHVIDTLGVDHVGIGADFDGGGGLVGFEDVTDYPKITLALLKRGLSEADVEKVWGGNTLRVLRAAEEYPKQNRMASTPRAQIVSEEFMIPAVDAGIELYVRNKRPRELTTFGAEKTVLFVHGATYPAHTTFDLPLDGFSWMDYIAQRGYDVYLLDLRGYGKSTRPREMSEPPERNPPIVRTDTAVNDVGAAVDFILKRRGLAKLNLIGWSWGCAIMATYTIGEPERVNKLVLHAPQWMREARLEAARMIGAYRTQTMAQAKERWFAQIPPGRQAEILPAKWFGAWTDATWATDPIGAKESPPVIRAPNGIQQDSREYWEAGKPLYDAARIRVPTLVAVGKWDAVTQAQQCFAALTNASAKRFVEVDDGSHHVMIEKHRLRLFEAVQEFLDQRRPTAR